MALASTLTAVTSNHPQESSQHNAPLDDIYGIVKLYLFITKIYIPVMIALWRAPQDTTFALTFSRLGASRSRGKV